MSTTIYGQPPLTARLEPWMTTLLNDPKQCAQLLQDYSSPVNVVSPEVLDRNARELVDAGTIHGVTVRVFFARKANKALAFADEARDKGHGIDVSSYRELHQVLDRGIDPHRVILSAAIKPDDLLRYAITSGVTISTDSRAELTRIATHTRALQEHTPGLKAHVAPRIAPDPAELPATRFGELGELWVRFCVEKKEDLAPYVDFAGVHAHLHGYSEADRRVALQDCLRVVDGLRDVGHSPRFVDLGGGVPMSYLDDANEWRTFQKARRDGVGTDLVTWKDNPLASTYPFHQTPTRGAWLDELLRGEVAGFGVAADALKIRGLALHLEPGRSVLDGGGVILARVAFVKKRSDGVDLVGLEMNRTQCRTTSDDILLDPVLVRTADWEDGADETVAAERRSRAGLRAFLVGAYCIEDEVIVWRQMTFPQGVAVGDCVAIPNTAGYFMHILESASHQIPLARNVVARNAAEGELDGEGADFAVDAKALKFQADDIDAY